MSEPVLEVAGLGKRFKIYDSPAQRVLEWAGRRKATLHRELWAVRDVSFQIEPGQVFGVIGVNGAGKSTLVKMLTGVLDPTEGGVRSRGRVLSLPELGADLNEPLTGRENVMVSAELLGIPREFIRGAVDRMLEFSELGDFFERPVATYSTGMRMRLAFSMFAFLECDLLILDEVMAVGDIFFQQKCYERISELIASGTAILLVTHDLNAIQHYANPVMVMHQGRKIFQGDATSAIQTFVQSRGTRTARAVESTYASREHFSEVVRDTSFDWPSLSESAWTPSGTPRGMARGRLTRMALLDDDMQATTTVFRQGEYAMFCFEFEVNQNIGVPVGILEISNAYNILVHSKNSLQLELDLPRHVAAGGRVRFIHRVKIGLEPAEYAFNVGLLSLHPDDYARVHELTQQDLNERLVWVCRQVRAGAFVVTFGFGRGMALTHAGICDLPSAGQVECAPPSGEDAPRG